MTISFTVTVSPVAYNTMASPPMLGLRQAITLPHAFTAKTLHDPASDAWNIDTGTGSHLNNFVTSLSVVFNTCIFSSVSVGDGHTIPATNTGHSILPTPHRPLDLNNVLITPHIVKNLIFVCKFVRDNNYTIEFDAFEFSVKDSMTRQKPLVLCHACQLDKHVRLPFFSSNTLVTSHLGIVHSDLWPSPILSLSGMFLSQRKYATEILEWAGMVSCNSNRTPVDTESKLGDDGDPVSDMTLYQSLAGSLQYLTFTRPDISYVVQQVCLYMYDPREPHFLAIKRVLRYVCGAMDYGLKLFSFSTTKLVAYSYVDWAGCPTTWFSTSEAEYRGVVNAIAETCWLRNLLRELHMPLSSATLVYNDNVRVLYVPSCYQYVDIFTKGLPSTFFEEFRTSLSVRCPLTPIARES
uniref:Ribonuclease H-like domain-containing protein n=1 Tax=Tanacetum cinerariifolium TaxID=118510 RepID=A0A6L2LVL9_TANCI|nr:ribonuclease H-like domain-containing protein [Tanacetum cinerariifolium]